MCCPRLCQKPTVREGLFANGALAYARASDTPFLTVPLFSATTPVLSRNLALLPASARRHASPRAVCLASGKQSPDCNSLQLCLADLKRGSRETPVAPRHTSFPRD